MAKVMKVKDLNKHFGILEGQVTVQHRVYELETTQTAIEKVETTKQFVADKIADLEERKAVINAEIAELQAMDAQMTKE